MRMPPILRVATAVVLSFTACAFAATTSSPSVKAEDLPRVPATELKDAIKTFRVRPGFHVELVAGEPNVIDPIAICFDENGRMFVVEMRDYSERRAEKLGRIRMLEDRDGDGVYETSTVFLDHLAWPTAVFYCNGGVLIGACPDIIFAKDTNGDGVADESKVLFTGFGTDEKLNVQGLFNNFQWGLDNRIHGCSGHDGGMVKQVLHPDKPPLDVRGKGFVINPRDWSMTTEAGGGQYGLSFDHLGRLFTCTNSSHCETFMYNARYGTNNPYATLPDPRISIAADGPAAEVYRISPEEPWRVIRTRWRIAGLVGGPVEGGGRSAGYFTGATGITIYRGDAFGPDYVGDAFVGDAGGNLVHHKRIRSGPDGITLVAKRPDDELKSEFLASTDNWFRPVDFANTPDGTLYVADMYREVIEHPWSLPPEIKKYLDLNSGNDRGRIYRITPDGFKPSRPPRFSEVTNAELVALLDHGNGWHRDTAARILFERQDRSPATNLSLCELASRGSPLGRISALHAMQGSAHGMDPDILLQALSDKDPRVRAHAIKLTEENDHSPQVLDRLAELAKDPDPTVRYQLAWTVGAIPHAQRATILAQLAAADVKSPWMQSAILASCGECAGDVLEKLSEPASPLGLQLAEMIGAKGDAADVEKVVGSIKSQADRSKRLAIAAALMQRSTLPLQQPLAFIKADAKPAALDVKAPSSERNNAISLLAGMGDIASVVELLRQPGNSTQSAALKALDRANPPDFAETVINAWPALSPRVRDDAAALLISRPARAKPLLDAIAGKRLEPTVLTASQAGFLRKHSDAVVKKQANEILPPPASRESVIAAFRPALSLTGNPSRGHELYARRCISCHRAGTEGSAVGPDFTTVKNAGKEKLLLNILDPNREVAPQYLSFLIETKDGQSVLGIVASDQPAGITIRQAFGRETVMSRAQIRRMSSQGQSLMPEGLEEKLTPQDLADLISFVESVH